MQQNLYCNVEKKNEKKNKTKQNTNNDVVSNFVAVH